MKCLRRQDRNQKDCVFLSTHEPCSLCLSAITWAGFDNFYLSVRLRGHQGAFFNIPHDLRILQEVFGVERGEYVCDNAFWTSHSIEAMIAELPGAESAGTARSHGNHCQHLCGACLQPIRLRARTLIFRYAKGLLGHEFGSNNDWGTQHMNKLTILKINTVPERLISGCSSGQ